MSTFDLEAEVRDLCARRDISEAIHNYARGLDRLDPETQRLAFHDDAEVDAGISQGNAAEFVAFCQQFLGEMDGTHHMLGQSQIKIDGTRASSETYFQAWHKVKDDNDEDRAQFVSGRYVDNLECRDGAWKIAKRTMVTDWATNIPHDEAFFDNSIGIIRGGSRGKDLTQQ